MGRTCTKIKVGAKHVQSVPETLCPMNLKEPFQGGAILQIFQSKNVAVCNITTVANKVFDSRAQLEPARTIYRNATIMSIGLGRCDRLVF